LGNGSAYYYDNVIAGSLDVYSTNAANTAIGSGTRELVERLYGISISAQLRAEAYLDSLNKIQPLNLAPFLNCPAVWSQNDLMYTRMVDRRMPDPCYVRKSGMTKFFLSPQHIAFQY